MITKKNNKKISICLLTTMLGLVFISSYAFADNVGTDVGSGGGGGIGGCVTGPIDTCHGATWRFYRWDEIKAGKHERAGIYYTGNGNSLEAIIAEYPHAVDKGDGYANGSVINNCEGTEGVWRYAMVAWRDGGNWDIRVNGKVVINGKKYHIYNNEQVGAIGIKNSLEGGRVFTSEFFNGKGKGMLYIGNSDSDGYSWNKAFKRYFEKQREYNFAFPYDKKWQCDPNNPTRCTDADPITWFCSSSDSYNPDPTFSANSRVSNGDQAKQTDIIPENRAPSTPEPIRKYLKIGDTSKLTFQHNLYADREITGADVSWRIERTFPSSGGYGFEDDDEGDKSGSVSSFTENVSGGYYIASNRPYSDGYNRFLAMDDYTVKFTRNGTYPFCEELYMNNVRMTKVCATYVVRDDTPPPTGDCAEFGNVTSGTSYTVSKVRNNTLNGSFSDEVYAKPKDDVEWLHCYYPGAQLLANESTTGLDPNVFGGNHGSHSKSLGSGGTTSNSYSPLYSFYNNKWTNYLKVTSNNNLRDPSPNRSPSSGNHRFGDAEIKSISDTYNVEYGPENRGKNKAGKTLIETSETGFPTETSISNDGTHSWDCDFYRADDCPCAEKDWRTEWDTGCLDTCSSPEDCQSCSKRVEFCKIYSSCPHATCHHSNDYMLGKASGNSASDHADVLIPYNFTNTTKIQLNSSVVYAGEQASSTNTVFTGTRYNDVTKGTYMTPVKDARLRIYAYTSSSSTGNNSAMIVGSGKGYNVCSNISSSNCNEVFDEDGQTLNSNGELEKEVSETFGSPSYNVYDVPAGTYYCVVAAVYPSSSGSDTMMETSGSNDWYVSEPSCVPVAKRPNLQVWGSLYTASNLNLEPAEKRVIDGFYGFSNKSITVFGSFAEQNIIANGKTNLASGASTGGYSSMFKERTPNPGLGGSNEGKMTNDCIRSPLTMPGCKSVEGVATGLPGSNINSGMNAPTDKKSLIGHFINKEGTNFTKITSFDEIEKITDGKIKIAKGKTYVLTSDSNITINDDIVYEDNYANLAEIPKLIIYTKGNINISCSVDQIDAVLIAGAVDAVNAVVDTCYDGGDVNSRARSNQLKVNGAIITNTMITGRTYGAATGANSGVPAEIVNYDTSLYLWGAPKSNVTSSGKMETVYRTELAPRL